MDLDKQIRELENEEGRLAQKKQNLKDKQQLLKELDSKLEKFLKETKFENPQELAEALIDQYGIRISERKSGTRRKRTTITAELRDTVKSYVNSGMSMNAISKQMEISYAVVVKIMKGSYDHLILRSTFQNSAGNSPKVA